LERPREARCRGRFTAGELDIVVINAGHQQTRESVDNRLRQI
jgi:hypothetical protein